MHLRQGLRLAEGGWKFRIPLGEAANDDPAPAARADDDPGPAAHADDAPLLAAAG